MHELSNKEISKILEEIANLLEIKGENKFKVRAYQNISRKITTLDQDITKLVKDNQLEEIKGIGEGIANEINDILDNGYSPALEELKEELPAGVLEMVEIPGLGPKRANKLFDELKISDISDLKKSLKSGEVRKIKGFGKKTEEKLLKSLNEYKEYKDLILLKSALEKAESVINEINKKQKNEIIKDLKLAGSIRRRKELLGDIDILVVTNSPDEAGELIKNQDFAGEIIDSGSKKISIFTKEKIRIDFRFISPENQFSALQHFTGSKEHNVKIRKIAKKNNYKLNEYGLFKIKEDGQFNRVEVNSEKELYNQLGLNYIIPELREDRGEIEGAANSNLPNSIEKSDIKGDLHIHSKYSDGDYDLEDLISKAKELGYEYIAFTDHSKSLKVANGMSEETIEKQLKKLQDLRENYSQIKILQGIEVDILSDGTLDYTDEILQKFDLVIASIHTGFNQSENKITNRIISAMENPLVDIIAHPQGRLLAKRKAYDVNMEKVIDKANLTNTCLEINASPDRLDLDDNLARKASEKGVKLVINTDAHNLKQFHNMSLGINVARRAWLEKDDVLNTMSYKELIDFLN